MEYLWLVIGLTVLTIAADFLVEGASGLAKRLRISDLIIGLTVVAVGTSAPELTVNVLAAAKGSSEIAITNILGSNLINILIIIGLSAAVFPISCKPNTFRYELPLSIIVNFCVLALGIAFGSINRLAGIILILLFFIFNTYTFRQALKDRKSRVQLPIEEHMSFVKIFELIVMGLGGLIWSGDVIVDNAVIVARNLGVSEAVIGFTIVAIGTSLPELATSVMAACKKNSDLAIGTVIGSNVFNVLFALGISAVIRPLELYQSFITDAIVVGCSSLLVWLFLLFNKQRRITRWEGISMIIIYVLYLIVMLN